MHAHLIVCAVQTKKRFEFRQSRLNKVGVLLRQGAFQRIGYGVHTVVAAKESVGKGASLQRRNKNTLIYLHPSKPLFESLS